MGNCISKVFDLPVARISTCTRCKAKVGAIHTCQRDSLQVSGLAMVCGSSQETLCNKRMILPRVDFEFEVDAELILILSLVLPWLTIPQILQVSATCKQFHDQIFATPALWREVRQRWPTDPFVHFLLPKISKHVKNLELTNIQDDEHVVQIPSMPSVVSLLISVVADKGSPAMLMLQKLNVLVERFPNLQKLSLVLQQFSIGVKDPSRFTRDPETGTFLQGITSKWPNLRGLSLIWESESLFCPPFRLSEGDVSEIFSPLQNDMQIFQMIHTNADTFLFIPSLKCVDPGGTALQYLGISSIEVNRIRPIDLSDLWHFKALHTFAWHLVDRDSSPKNEYLSTDLSALGDVTTLKCLKVRGLILWSAQNMIALFCRAKFRLQTIAMCMDTNRSLDQIKFNFDDDVLKALAEKQTHLKHVSISCCQHGVLRITDSSTLSLGELPSLEYLSLGSQLTHVTSEVWEHILHGNQTGLKWQNIRVLLIDQPIRCWKMRHYDDLLRLMQMRMEYLFGSGSVARSNLEGLSLDDAKNVIKSAGYSSDEIMRRIVKLKWPQLTM